MAAILRVKRRHDDEPLNTLVISRKRQKTTDDEVIEEVFPTSLTTIAKLAGTIAKQEDSVDHLIQNYRKDELQTYFKQHPIDIINKVREITKQTSVENRYKVINCFRSLNNIESSEEKVMTVIDVEDSISIEKKDSLEKDDNYVYDLYYVHTENDICLDDIAIHPYEQELVFDTYRDDRYPEDEHESDDSNSESNWRNDYPDSENYSEKSIDEDDMREAVMNMRLDEESDLSEEDDFIYAVDENDVNTYGYKYARYKARIKKELEEDENHFSDYSICVSEESDEDNDNLDYVS